jgi:hypothetical protein
MYGLVRQGAVLAASGSPLNRGASPYPARRTRLAVSGSQYPDRRY